MMVSFKKEIYNIFNMLSSILFMLKTLSEKKCGGNDVV